MSTVDEGLSNKLIHTHLEAYNSFANLLYFLFFSIEGKIHRGIKVNLEFKSQNSFKISEIISRLYQTKILLLKIYRLNLTLFEL